MFNITDNLKELLIDLYSDFAKMSFKWLNKFMLKATDLTQYDFVKEMNMTMLILSTSMGVMFMMFALFKIQFQRWGAMQSRSTQEVFVKTIFATLFATSAPWLFTEVLLKTANSITMMAVNKGITTKTMKDLTESPGDASLAIVLTITVIAFMFVVLLFQYVRRIGEILILTAFSSIAAYTLINDEMNVFPMWWRECTIIAIQQPFQVWSLWLAFNYIGTGKELEDYCIAIGILSLVLSGPGWLRNFLYSTGAGRTLANAAGGAGKMVLAKYVSKKFF
ncbi:conjugal transfer protein TrbL family protein [Fictibacillus sp. NRS-1165]|uniref:conjugal transfer protein TrbL family protein n=1 Tax=Fictibacillus sp. NRS-1165 TaxID=3144463 RepID=UPI003D1EF50C